MPLAAHATIDGGGLLKLQAAWGDPDGDTTLVTAAMDMIASGLSEAEALGLRVAQALQQGGAH